MTATDREKESRWGTGTVRSLSGRRRSGKRNVSPRREFEPLRNFFPLLRVYVIDALIDLRIYRVICIHSRTTKPHIFAASLIFLMASAFCMEPIPCDPREITALDEPHAKVDKDQMTVAHGAEVEKRRPGHCGISREASMACKAASCSASCRRRSSAKRKSMIRMPHMSQPAIFQRTGGQN